MARKSHTPQTPSTPKPRYHVSNWPEYNRAIVQRGSITLWLSDEVAQGWRAQDGKGCVYSDVAIRCGLSLRAVFNLTLRQTQGFLASFATKLLPGLPVPHYSTFCRPIARQAICDANLPRGGGRAGSAAAQAPTRGYSSGYPRALLCNTLPGSG